MRKRQKLPRHKWQILYKKQSASTWMCLKGACHKVFDLYFFMIWTHLGPWQTSYSIFKFFFRFRWGIHIFKKLCGVHCASHGRVNPSQCDAAASQSPRCASLKGVNLNSVHGTAVWIALRSQTAHQGDKIKIFACLWLILKEQSGEIPLGVKNTSFMREKIWSKTKL